MIWIIVAAIGGLVIGGGVVFLYFAYQISKMWERT